jgi:hypothetical protein
MEEEEDPGPPQRGGEGSLQEEWAISPVDLSIPPSSNITSILESSEVDVGGSQREMVRIIHRRCIISIVIQPIDTSDLLWTF